MTEEKRAAEARRFVDRIDRIDRVLMDLMLDLHQAAAIESRSDVRDARNALTRARVRLAEVAK